MSRFPDLPDRMRSLPVDHRGFPVPWFVAWQDGKPVFPAMDSDKLRQAIQFGKCWVCGHPLGRFKYYVVGPMCVVNLISSEPPSHLECAQFSAKHCPFLANPRMGRVPEEKYGGVGGAGEMIKRNPGVTALVEVQGPISYHGDGRGGVLFKIAPIASVQWWACGRFATSDEVNEAMRTGIPLLQERAAEDGPKAEKLLASYVDAARQWLPKEVAA